MLAMAAFLLENNISLNVASDVLYQFIISVSTGERSFDEIVPLVKKQHSTH